MPTTNDAMKVSAGKPKVGGAIFLAPTSTSLPTTATETLNAAFAGVGYISEDGVTNTLNKDISKIKAWGGDVVLVLNNGLEDQFKFKMIQSMDSNALKAVFGDSNVTVTAAIGGTPAKIDIKVNNNEQDAKAWVIETILNGGSLKRIVIPNAKVEAIGDIVYRDNEAIGFEITLAASADSSGNSHYEYISGPTGATGATGTT